MSTPATGANRQWVLAHVPSDRLTTDDFELRTIDADPDTDQIPAGHARCRVLWLSIDAAGRAWMQGATYRSAVEEGDVMSGYGIAEVVASEDPALASGQLVVGDVGWQDLAVVRPRQVQVLAPGSRPLANHLSVLGITGLTAYFGLLDVARARAGETVVVSAAAGATGNVVGQIAKRLGCRVVGIAGSDAKRAWLTETLGLDATVSHRSDALRADLTQACPDGIDVYFDNVGGPVLEAVLARMNEGGRVACCGAISQYDTGTPAPGPRGVPGLLVTKRLTMQGFIVMDFAHRYGEAIANLESWLDDGSVVATEDVLEGLESAPAGLVGLLAGDNVGKRLIHVADPSASLGRPS